MKPFDPTKSVQQLQIAVAEKMGWTDLRWIGQEGDKTLYGKPAIRPGGICVPDYSTSLDAIQAACLEKFKDSRHKATFTCNLYDKGLKLEPNKCLWQLTAADWCEAFLATCKEIEK